MFMVTSSKLFRRAENSRSFDQDFCEGQASWLNLDKGGIISSSSRQFNDFLALTVANATSDSDTLA
jgi:hypothetical protein